tara:strand:- start:21118 stop:21507 length:390 start_codon:yes stop_codon:yes gene_type:complete
MSSLNYKEYLQTGENLSYEILYDVWEAMDHAHKALSRLDDEQGRKLLSVFPELSSLAMTFGQIAEVRSNLPMPSGLAMNSEGIAHDRVLNLLRWCESNTEQWEAQQLLPIAKEHSPIDDQPLVDEEKTF